MFGISDTQGVGGGQSGMKLYKQPLNEFKCIYTAHVSPLKQAVGGTWKENIRREKLYMTLNKG